MVPLSLVADWEGGLSKRQNASNTARQQHCYTLKLPSAISMFVRDPGPLLS